MHINHASLQALEGQFVHNHPMMSNYSEQNTRCQKLNCAAHLCDLYPRIYTKVIIESCVAVGVHTTVKKWHHSTVSWEHEDFIQHVPCMSQTRERSESCRTQTLMVCEKLREWRRLPDARPLARPATSNARATRGHNLITGVHGSRRPDLHPPSSTASVTAWEG